MFFSGYILNPELYPGKLPILVQYAVQQAMRTMPCSCLADLVPVRNLPGSSRGRVACGTT